MLKNPYIRGWPYFSGQGHKKTTEFENIWGKQDTLGGVSPLLQSQCRNICCRSAPRLCHSLKEENVEGEEGLQWEWYDYYDDYNYNIVIVEWLLSSMMSDQRNSTTTRQCDEKPSTDCRPSTRNDEKRKCTNTTMNGDWKENDPEGRIRRDEERKRRKYNEKRRSGGGEHVSRERTDERRRHIDEKRRSRPVNEQPRSSQSRHASNGHARQSSSGRSHGVVRCNERCVERETKNNQHSSKQTTPPHDESVDVVEEMLKSFPPSSPAVPGSRYRTSHVTNPLAPVTGTWGDEMDAGEVVKKEQNTESDAPNPWKRSESMGERLTDEKRLKKRQRQIDIGKATEAYAIYCEKVPLKERTKHHPQTPDKGVACSSRSWQGVMRIWRRKLHYWDTPEVTKKYQQKLSHMLPFDDSDAEDEEMDPEVKGYPKESNIELLAVGKKFQEGCDDGTCSGSGVDSQHNDDEIITEAMLF